MDDNLMEFRTSTNVPEVTVRRLCQYSRHLEDLRDQGVKNISSKALSELMQIKDSQLRKDLAYFGAFGVRGLGYDVEGLSSRLATILGTVKPYSVAVLGAGNLCAALTSYPGFKPHGFHIQALLDNDENKIGREFHGIQVYDVKRLPEVLEMHGIEIVIVTVPVKIAQELFDQCVECGIKAFLNFAPLRLMHDRTKVKVADVDASCSLKVLSFFLTQSEE